MKKLEILFIAITLYCVVLFIGSYTEIIPDYMSWITTIVGLGGIVLILIIGLIIVLLFSIAETLGILIEKTTGRKKFSRFLLKKELHSIDKIYEGLTIMCFVCLILFIFGFITIDIIYLLVILGIIALAAIIYLPKTLRKRFRISKF